MLSAEVRQTRPRATSGDCALRCLAIPGAKTPVPPVLCILDGCNGAGKTMLAREPLLSLGMMRLLNAEGIASGRSPLDPTFWAFLTGHLVPGGNAITHRGEGAGAGLHLAASHRDWFCHAAGRACAPPCAWDWTVIMWRTGMGTVALTAAVSYISPGTHLPCGRISEKLGP